MNSKFSEILIESLKIAGATWIVVWADPWTAKTFPTFPVSLRYLLSAVIAALVIEILMQIIFGWPHIDIRWRDEAQKSEVEIREICAHIRPSNPNSQAFELNVSSKSNGFFGRFFLKQISKNGTKIHIKIVTASVVPTRETSSKIGGNPAVEELAEHGGFSILLGDPPRRPGEWHFAKVRWRNESTQFNIGFNVDYVLENSSCKAKNFLFKLVRISSNVDQFRIVGS